MNHALSNYKTTSRDVAQTTSRSSFLRCTILFFLLVGGILVITPADWYPSWLFPKVAGLGLVAYALLATLPHFIFARRGQPSDEARRRALQRLENVIGFGLLLSAAGMLGFYELYRYGFEYDKVIHFLFPLLGALVISQFFHVWYEIAFTRAVYLTALLIFAGSIMWEFYEFTADQVFHSGAFGQGGTRIFEDTTLDLLMNFFGISFAVLITKSRFSSRFSRSSP
mgnify:CR=1 FL=1